MPRSSRQRTPRSHIGKNPYVRNQHRLSRPQPSPEPHPSGQKRDGHRDSNSRLTRTHASGMPSMQEMDGNHESHDESRQFQQDNPSDLVVYQIIASKQPTPAPTHRAQPSGNIERAGCVEMGSVPRLRQPRHHRKAPGQTEVAGWGSEGGGRRGRGHRGHRHRQRRERRSNQIYSEPREA